MKFEVRSSNEEFRITSNDDFFILNSNFELRTLRSVEVFVAR